MKKVIKIDGMSCGHCQAKVEKALSKIEDSKVKVDLKKKTATITAKSDIDDSLIKSTISDAGFLVVSIEEKKGLF